MSYIDKISVGGTVYDIQDSNAAPQIEVDKLKNALQLSDDALYQVTNIDYTTNKNWKKYCRATQQGSYAPGALVSCNQSTDGFYSDLIPTGKAKIATAYSVGGGGVAIICFYKADGTFDSAVPGTSSSAFKWYSASIPDTAAFVRFSAYSTSLDLAANCKAWIGVGSGGIDGTAFVSRIPISANTDLNNLTNNGVYLLFSGYTYTNAPSFYSSGQAWVFVYDALTVDGYPFRFQTFVKSSNKVFATRTYTTSGGVGSWGNWTIYDEKYNALLSKKMSIVGDSISTYKNYIPDPYVWYYPQPAPADVDSVSKTWWKQVIDKSGMTLLKNASWSGSRVSWIAGTSEEEMAKVAYTNTRIGDLADGSTTPDIVVVLIGTNDFGDSIALGTQDANTELPSVSGEITDFRAAYAAMINNIRTTYPHAHVYCCTLIQRYYSTDETYPIKNESGNALALYNRAIMDVAEWMGCEVIRLDTVISLGELSDYTIDGRIHPNAAGMTKIADKVLQKIVQCETTY